MTITKSIASLENWLGKDNKLGQDIWLKKYRNGEENFQDWINRISFNDAEYAKLILDKKFIPGGRILANAGTNRGAYSNCAVLSSDKLDSIDDIMERAKEMAMLFKKGIGLGFGVHSIRPKGAKTSDGGIAPGIIPFMELFSSVTGSIASGGRRGASLLFCDAYHPQAIEFCQCKLDKNNKITNANISLWIDDEFMAKAKKGIIEERVWLIKDTGEEFKYTLDYKAVIDTAVDCAHKSAEPAVLFKDSYINNCFTQHIKELEPKGVNGCCFTGDMRLLTTEGYKRFDELVGTNPTIFDKDGNTSVSNIWESGIKNVYELKMEDGKIIKCTDNHVFLTIDNEQIQASDLIGKKIKRFDSNCVSPTVISINYIGQQMVYDFNEPNTNFGVVEGFIAHNSEFSGTNNSTCLLGSMNLAQYVNNKQFNYEEFGKDVMIATNFLNKALLEGIDKLPTKEMKEVAKTQRQIGLGCLGLADAFINMEIKYGSKESCDVIDKIFSTMLNASVEASLCHMDDAFAYYDKEKVKNSTMYKMLNDENKKALETLGLYNSRLLAIAPTGTSSSTLGVSSGIEPIYQKEYTRRTQSLHGEDVFYTIKHKAVEDYIKNNPNAPTDHIVDAYDVSWQDKVNLLATIQKYIDNAISNTTNIPKESTVDGINEIYFTAWEKGLKGVSIYRDGSLDSQVLSAIEKDKKEDKKKDKLDKSDLIGKRVECQHGCGRFTLHVYLKPNGDVHDIFVTTKSNGCTANIQALAIAISELLKKGMSPEKIKSKLSGMGACPSFAVAKAKGIVTDLKSSSCSNLIINTIIDVIKNYNQQIVIPKAIESLSIKDVVDTNIEGIPCKVCGQPLSIESGCKECPHCGTVNCN